MLYAATGDAGTSSRSQNLSSLSGKILRMTAEGRVPADNPFSGSYVYSYGHRNVQGLAWASDGSMYASEFGQNTWDELNQIKAGGNYGWPDVEGKAGNSKYTDPLQQWATADASPSGIAISGGNIYIANLRGERLRKVPLAATSTATEFYVKEYGRLRDVVVAPDGRLYVLTNNTDGRGTPKAGDDRVLSVPVL
jgi:glucose/arabinose dehydrogenase